MFHDETTKPHRAWQNPEWTSFELVQAMAIQGDSLGALIVAIRELPEREAGLIVDFCEKPAYEANLIISDTIAITGKRLVRRRARNVQRRLLVAKLHATFNMPLDSLRGMKYKTMLKLAKAKLVNSKIN